MLAMTLTFALMFSPVINCMAAQETDAGSVGSFGSETMASEGSKLLTEDAVTMAADQTIEPENTDEADASYEEEESAAFSDTPSESVTDTPASDDPSDASVPEDDDPIEDAPGETTIENEEAEHPEEDDPDIAEEILADGSPVLYDGFTLDWPGYDDDKTQYKLCYLSPDHSDSFGVCLWRGDEPTYISSKELAASAFNVDVSDVDDDCVTYELLKKSGNEFVAAGVGEGPVEITDQDDLLLHIQKKAEQSDVLYYLRVTVKYADRFKSGVKNVITLPITNAPTEYCDTKEETYEAVRDIVRCRVNNMAKYYDARNYRSFNKDGYIYERIYVKSDLFNGSINLEDVYDFAAEREGMLPDEGDYMLNLFRNRIKRTTYYEHPSVSGEGLKTIGSTRKGDNYYNIYEIYLPVITTSAEEQAVDSKVNSLLNTEFATVKDKTNKQKIRAVYNYITSHVSGTVSGAGGGDRTYPLYHTAYHALIKGNGTCESFAMLFTRLTRELGVASKIIMGVDSGAHTYNIVDGGDGYWYFIDCSSGRYLSDGKSFQRATEQARYTSPRYTLNYWNKIKGGSNYSAKTIKILNHGEVVTEADSLESVVEYINKNTPNPEPEDPEPEWPEWVVRFDSNWTTEMQGLSNFSHPELVSIDLNGHRLQCKNECGFDVKEIYNGTIRAGYNSRGIMYSGNVTFGYPTPLTLSNVKFEGVTGYDKVNFYLGGIENVVLDNVTFKKVYVSVKTFEPECPYDYSLHLKNTVTLDNCYFYIQNKEGYDKPVIYTKTCDEDGNLLYKGKLALKGTVTFGEKIYNEKTVQKPIQFAVAGPGYFASGDVVATCSGTVKRVKNTSGKIQSTTLSKVFDLQATQTGMDPEDTQLSLVEMNKAFVFAKPTYALYKDEESEENLIGKYVKWADTVSAINKNNGKNPYVVKLLANTSGLESFTFPKKASVLTVSGGEEGYTLSHKGSLKLTCPLTLENLTLSPAGSKAVLNLNGKSLKLTGVSLGSDGSTYASIKGSGASALHLASTTEEDGANRIDYRKKANIASVYVEDTQDESGNCTGSYFFANLTSKKIICEEGNTLHAGKINATNLSLKNGAVLAVDNSADIKNLQIAKDTSLIRQANTTFRIRSKFTASADDSVLTVTTVDESGNATGTNGGAAVFNTDMRSFPYDLVAIKQTASLARFDKLIKIGKQIIVATDWFELQKSSNPEEEAYASIGEFAKWSDMIAEINKLNDAGAYYRILVKEDVTTREALTLPKKAKHLTIAGKDGENVKLTFNGNFSPATDTELTNIDLISTSKKAKCSLANRTVVLTDATISTAKGALASVSGKKGASLILKGTGADPLPFTVKGNISLGTLRTENASVTSTSGSLTVSKFLSMKSSSVDTALNVKVKDLESLDNNNAIAYAKNKKGTFTISGNMTASEETVTAVSDAGKEMSVNLYAISIKPKYMNGRYSSAANLKKTIVTAGKVPASCFVVERYDVDETGRVKVHALTIKTKNAVKLSAQ